MSAEIPVLARTAGWIAVDKPPGLAVHRSRMTGADREFLLQRVRDQIGQHLYPVHRLDRPTSGVLLFGLSSEAARTLQAALAEPEAIKEYLVLVRGSTETKFHSNRPLTERRPNGEKIPREALTHFEKIGEFEGCSLLKARLVTGRRHQIRRHLQHISHQVIGDTEYGKGRLNRRLREQYGLPRLFLHAIRLSFREPDAEAPVTIEAPLAEDLRSFLNRLPDFPRDEFVNWKL